MVTFTEALKVRCPLCLAEPKAFCVGVGKHSYLKGERLSTLHNERLRAATVAPHDLFRVWSPDTVAECLDGVDMELYRRLYATIPVRGSRASRCVCVSAARFSTIHSMKERCDEQVQNWRPRARELPWS